jgi:uroporphyrinogen decarboxylase
VSEKRERLAAALAGEAVDRLPVTLWRHNFLREWTADDLSDETIALYRRFDWDLIKLNPRWSYLPEAWGNAYEPPTDQRFQKELRRVVQGPKDLDRIEPADVNHPSLVEQLDALGQVVSTVANEVDVLHTVFSPLSVAGLLAGGIGKPLLEYARENPSGLDAALFAIRETVAAHIQAALDRGASGIFFAPTQWTSLDVCDAETYERFGRPHDLWVLERAQQARMNVLHICDNRIGVERFLDYPVDVFSWDDRGEGNPSLRELGRRTDRIVMAGVPHKRFHRMSDEELLESVSSAVGTQTRRTILAGGCAVGALVDAGRMRAVRDVVNRLDRGRDD